LAGRCDLSLIGGSSSNSSNSSNKLASDHDDATDKIIANDKSIADTNMHGLKRKGDPNIPATILEALPLITNTNGSTIIATTRNFMKWGNFQQTKRIVNCVTTLKE
jgi:hypothetical protein